MKKRNTPFLGPLLKKIAPRIGAKVTIEPEWQVVGQIAFKNGKKRYFRNTCIDLNSLGSSEIARDKNYSTFFMKKMGYSTIPGKTFYSNKWAKAIGDPERNIDAGFLYAESLGLPVIIKPNSGTQGQGVSLVHNKNQFYKGMRHIFKEDKIALIQKLVKGNDYRIVVLDDKIISAYERLPLSVIGDGKSNIRKLLKEKQRLFIKNKRDTRINFNDHRIIDKLKLQNLNFNSIPKQGMQIQLLDNANLSTGGESIDVTDDIHPTVKQLAIKLTRDMGLRLCGVDIMIEGDINNKLKKYHILEINAAPGLDHYVTNGKKQEKIVEDLYLEVLKNMGK